LLEKTGDNQLQSFSIHKIYYYRGLYCVPQVLTGTSWNQVDSDWNFLSRVTCQISREHPPKFPPGFQLEVNFQSVPLEPSPTKFQLDPGGSNWFQLVPGGSGWFQVVPVGKTAILVNIPIIVRGLSYLILGNQIKCFANPK